MKWRWNRSYRRIYIQRYVAIYRVDEKANTVRIYRIFHGSRNFKHGMDVELMERRAEYQPLAPQSPPLTARAAARCSQATPA
ncbi:MAG: type II toxin-antitoxin system RelE/ParE family toxin [Chitinispirillales bacterium]|nr:type II toxin-antitoxin system RelE/ParE family toxin [Chitinispirillales bacterium]